MVGNWSGWVGEEWVRSPHCSVLCGPVRSLRSSTKVLLLVCLHVVGVVYCIWRVWMNRQTPPPPPPSSSSPRGKLLCELRRVITIIFMWSTQVNGMLTMLTSCSCSGQKSEEAYRLLVEYLIWSISLSSLSFILMQKMRYPVLTLLMFPTHTSIDFCCIFEQKHKE